MTDQPLKSAIRSMDTTHTTMVMLRSKVLIVGDPHIGKTAMVKMFTTAGQEYPKNYLMTLGVELSVKSVQTEVKNMAVELYLFDCGGQSIFNQLDNAQRNYENASSAVVVFDIGNRDSFLASAKWLSTARQARNSPIEAVLVGMKSDLRKAGRAEVQMEEAKLFASQNGMHYFEVSALENQGVAEPFKWLAESFRKKYEKFIERVENLG